ncbi:lytic transglycosylase domain-containing protein [Ruixingdingia sedimenti]|uniref:Lytic transglycosylase domain-containing protein n=1 Tax=Ruixingdingia sedimenti TaxID=3073604 RepID=A0ABU1F828_9RHOB|nr:lytic transglycosylase domain-containing protein [Xinfangfangia sp. LG-4]MDR5653029.1 lytic transglycosylase domain-containing protein [Xinfangfangia sp. LG-4]
MRTALLFAPILAAALALSSAPAAPAQDAPLARAMARAAAQDWAAAAEAAQPLGPLAADIVEWMRLRAGEGRLGDYEAFVARRADWPGLDLLRRRGEAAVARSQTPARVIAWFADTAPQTAEGALALVRALRAAGQDTRADAVAAAAWAELPFTADEQAAMLLLAGPALAAHHTTRMDHLLWRGRAPEAERLIPFVPEGWQHLARARLALAADAAGVDGFIALVPPDLAGDPGLAHARFEWRLRKGRQADAAALIVERSDSADRLGRPDAWAARRTGLARALMQAGEVGTAYRVAAGHHLTAGADFAELEFLAGYIALRKRADPATALAHFRRLAAGVTSPISTARAAYWEGRALEALGQDTEAQAAYARAAAEMSTYYGLLAAERLDHPMAPALAAPPALPDWRQAGFLSSSVFEAALLLYRAGEVGQARRFLLHLAEGLDDAGLAQLAGFALDLGAPNIAVLVAKQAAARGVTLPAALFPEPALLPEGLAVPRPLAMAIARRESEFDPAARSPAGARGLMQVMPGTAELMARKLGIAHDAARLDDPAHNARLGAAYLAQLTDEFGSALALVAAGYNAGPGRPRAWIADLGDPRHPQADPVDWVEHVPFAETRTYIMRVAEALAIYQARADRSAAPVRLTRLLAGR